MNFIKTISSLIPFLAPYPTWVKLLVAGWLICTAFLLASLLLVRPNSVQPPSSLSIKAPEAGARVGQFVTVKGLTNLKTLFHYIVVGPQTGSVWVTDGPLLIDEDGHWTGRAQLGTGTIGDGEAFLIHVVATTRQLSIGEQSMQMVQNLSSGIATVQVERKLREDTK